MPNLKDIRRRIGSVKNTQRITKTMKMIAAVKLRKAQDQILAARPYAHELISVISNLALHIENPEQQHPLLIQRKAKNVRLFIVSSDRGKCGGYNGNIIRRTEKFIRETKGLFQELKFSFIGRKVHDYFKRRLDPSLIEKYYSDVMIEPTFDKAADIADEMMDDFLNENVDHVYLIYNEFKSAMSQKVVVESLLPVQPKKEDAEIIAKLDYLYEPSREKVLKALLPKHIRVQMFRILLEAASSEHGARMTAMDSATTNAGEMISKLTLLSNRVRQAAITRELMEIVSGAEALR